MIPAKTGRGFICLNITQFFGAGNDNVLKQVLIFGVATGGLWKGIFGNGAQAYASLCLAVPFVVFSGFAGQFSDRFSKRSVSIVVKIAEVIIAAIAWWGLWLTNVWIVLFAMVLLAAQSAFFTPAKFGILPEIVVPDKLSRANGTINMFTYIAVILGSAVGGAIYDAYAPDLAKSPNAVPALSLPGLILLIVAALGLAASFGIPHVVASNPKLRLRALFFRTYINTWREVSGTPLASVITAWSFYYLIVGGVAIMIIPDYKSMLNISATQTSILFALLGVFTGIGDYTAGRVSGHGIRPELIPLGGLGTAILFFWLGMMPLSVVWVCIWLSATGFLAGFAMVPLQTMTQRLSAQERRGQVLGLWNCLSFVGIIVGNLLFLVVRKLGLPSNRVFLICGALAMLFSAIYQFHWHPIFRKAIDQAGAK